MRLAANKDPRGLLIRSAAVCWIFCDELHPLTLTQMAQQFDLDKQSLGRWLESFKQEFPHIRTCHMAHE